MRAVKERRTADESSRHGCLEKYGERIAAVGVVVKRKCESK